MNNNLIVLDANILIRAVVGVKVKNLIFQHIKKVNFITPEVCINDAKKYLPAILQKKSVDPIASTNVLTQIECAVQPIDYEVYSVYKEDAIKRIGMRDLNDWPIIATSLTFECPIWSEDQDFFGTGIPTWTTDRVHLFLETFKEQDTLINV